MGDYLFFNITDLLQKYHKTSINPNIKTILECADIKAKSSQ